MPTATAKSGMTAEEFYDWANRPENADRNYELDRGEVVEVPSPQRPHGVYCWLAAMALGNYLLRRGTGYMCTNDTGIIVARKPDTVRGADVILFLDANPGDPVKPGYVDDVPTLVVEVLSPTDRPGKTSRRVEQYIRRGIPLVWLIDPDDRLVTVYRPDELSRTLDETDELTGNGVLPGFSCRVRDLYEVPGQPPAPAADPPPPAPKPRTRKGPRK